MASKAPVAAFFSSTTVGQSDGRWRWTIVVQGSVMAFSTSTYPTEHDANDAARAISRQLENGKR